ncbi:hypothetical protein K503DRAFT_859410 [Rhizopogon vinicolor AM-OR11-026]|uniref:DUF6534 domain-containing protein n=1 Tax=Rhizopogon vinicolor AM-OR11-026 TaxID=1314800 RepID=A0A1B7MNC1_9AGAM|nr:hypothetical protein K503DRAFT_859410 [Rhizopogon vinicolor AM-OR11-026]
MATAAHSVEMALGPGFIGVAPALVTLDGLLHLNINTSLLDCVHTAGLLWTFWHMLLTCRRSTSPDCLGTSFRWEMLFSFFGALSIGLSVQSFYVHRVWIISGRNNLVTGVVSLVAVAQILFAFLSAKVVVKSRDLQVMYSSPVCVLLKFMRCLIIACPLQYPALSAGSGSLCDVLITISIAYFLRSRSQMRRQDNYIRQLKVIFIEMGLISCIISTLVTVTLALPDSKARQNWGPAPGPLQTKTYFNSMLAVLNARKLIRERQMEGRGQMYELRTLGSSIYHSLEDN